LMTWPVGRSLTAVPDMPSVNGVALWIRAPPSLRSRAG
jgi:hypothetical protein